MTALTPAVLNPSDNVSAADVAGLFDPNIADALSLEERSVISTLLSSDDRTDVAIPENISPDDLWKTLELCCRVFIRVRKANAQLKLLIGRSLVLIQDNPELFKSRGFNSFDSFMTREDGLPGLTGISRSELYKAKTVADTFPTIISLGDSRELGVTKLSLIAQVTKEGNSDAQSWVDFAKDNTIPELKARIYRSDKGISEGALEVETLYITLTGDQKQTVEQFLNDAEIQAYAGSKMPGVILCAAIAELEEIWKQQQCGE